MADPTRGRKKRWSYNAGERGRNWVRAFEHARDGAYYLEWLEEHEATDPETGEVATVQRRRRKKLREEDQTPRRAIAKAEELAERFADLLANPEEPVTLAGLMKHYVQEVTPRKGQGKQGHDRRAHRVFRAYFDGRPEAGRRSDRHPSTLDRIDWEGFVAARRGGQVAGWKPVADRQVQYDLKWMLSVLNWATGAKPVGGERPYLVANPWGTEIRRAQRWPMPRTKTPHRPGMTDELREGLVKHAPSWQFGLALVLERDTRRRNSAIRHLDWADIDQQAWTIRWRGEHDKDGREAVTPLLGEEAREALRRAPSRGIAGPVFPSSADPSKPTPRHTFQTWLRRAKERLLNAQPEEERAAWRERLRRVGFHAEKRAGVRDARFRALPAAVQELIAGTRYETLRTVYDEVSADDVREAWKVAQAAVRAAES
jgi:integrase